MSFEYDGVGNRTKRTDYNGAVTTYQYNNLNRLTAILYGSTVGASYAYDDLSRLATAVNDAGTVAFTYDNRSRIKTTTDVFNHIIEYGYDANGNRTSLKLDNADYAAYAYDAANRLSSITNSSDSTVIGFGYDTADRLASRTYPNGVNTTYEYDGMSRLTHLVDISPVETVSDYQYTYNAANQISQITEPWRTRTYGYDNVDRLTSVTDTFNHNESYAYDAVGNRTSSHRSSTYGYQPFNKLTANQTSAYEFAANGNTSIKTGAGNADYLWDNENRMYFAINGSGKTSEYKYDALGRRVSAHTHSFVSGDETTNFTYDGQDVLMDDNGGIVKYQNGPGIDNKLSLSMEARDTQYFIKDHLGSTVGLIDASLRAQYADFDSFGNPVNSSLQTRYQFTGREYDSTTELQYSRARWYDPNLGRFISEDPIGFAGGDINLYGYVSNNPLNFTDPTGLDGLGNDAADWLDSNINYARGAYKADPAYWGWNGAVDTLGDLSSLAVDPLRVGSGLGYAVYDPDASGWQRAGGVGSDVLRAVAIAGPLAGLGSKGIGLLARFGAPAEAIEACPLPYARSRPAYGSGQIEAVWENAKTPSGQVFDPYTGEELFWDTSKPRNGQWDMGHKPGNRYNDYHSQYTNGRLTKDQFLDIHRNPNNYRPQSVYSNRSGRYH